MKLLLISILASLLLFGCTQPVQPTSTPVPTILLTTTPSAVVSNEITVTPSLQSTPNTESIQDCGELTGQQSEGGLQTVTATPAPKGPDNGNNKYSIIARVLSTKPFVIQILDSDGSIPYGDFPIDITGDLPLSNPSEITGLKFNDLISSEVWSYYYDAGELAIGYYLKNIKKIGGKPNYFTNNTSDLEKKTNILIRYVPSTSTNGERLLIYNDGNVWYLDNHNNILNRKISASELNNLLKLFGTAKFDSISSDAIQSDKPSIMLICRRYQKVKLDQNSAQLGEIVKSLDNLIKNYESQADKILKVEQSIKLNEWNYGGIVDLNNINKIGFQRPSQIVPVTLIAESATRSYIGENDVVGNTFYLNGDRIYRTWLKPECLPTKTCTWNDFGAEELKMAKSGGSYYQIWPSEIGIKLKDVPKDGIKIQPEEYAKNRAIYDSFIVWKSDLYYREGNFLYRKVSLITK